MPTSFFFDADGVLIRGNEPAGGQHAFHFHMHVFPRYTNDNFYTEIVNKKATEPEDRVEYIEKLKTALQATAK